SAHPIAERRRVEDLTAPQQPLQSREIVRTHGVQLGHEVQDRRHREPLCELGRADELGELVWQQVQLVRHEVERRPRGKAAEHVEGGKVEVQRSEEHTSELQSRFDLVCRLLLEKKKKNKATSQHPHETNTP